MQNLDLKIENNKLTIVVDLTQEQGDSRRGVSTIIASSGGNLRLFDADGFRDEILNMTISKRKPRDSTWF
jgi:hypothetical protein